MHSHSQGPWVSHTTEAGEVIRLTGWKGTHSSTWALPSTYGLDRESGGACRSPPPWSQWSDCYVAHHYPIHLSVNWQKAGGPQPGCKCKSSGGLGTSSTADSWAGPAQMSPGRTGQTFWEQNSRSNPRSKLRVSLRSTTKRPQAPWEGGKERRGDRTGSLLKCNEFTRKWKSARPTANTKGISKGRLRLPKKHPLETPSDIQGESLGVIHAFWVIRGSQWDFKLQQIVNLMQMAFPHLL